MNINNMYYCNNLEEIISKKILYMPISTLYAPYMTKERKVKFHKFYWSGKVWMDGKTKDALTQFNSPIGILGTVINVEWDKNDKLWFWYTPLAKKVILNYDNFGTESNAVKFYINHIQNDLIDNRHYRIVKKVMEEWLKQNKEK